MKTLKNKWLRVAICILSLMATRPALAQISDPEQEDSTQRTISKLYQDVEVLKRFKISGYFQPQFQFADSAGIKSFAGGDFPTYSDKRFLLRRARLKATYTGAHSSFVLQIDGTENGTISLKDAYFKYTEPYLELVSITAGVFNRPFGYEITFSSSDRESPERGRMSQTIFPGERDNGIMFTVQAPKTSRWNFLKLDAAIVSGTGLGFKEFDKKKDVIGHLSANKASRNEKIKVGLGLSLYDGGFAYNNDTAYKVTTINDTTKNYTIEKVKTGNYSTRQYYGVDAQFSIDWFPGITTIRGEYITGDQPATAADSKSIGSAIVGADNKTGIGAYTFLRKFDGAYFYFLQNIAQTKAQIVVKYDWYDPNKDLKGTEIGKATKSSAADIAYSTWGFGAIWHFDQNLKLMAYYDVVKNESTSLKGYSQDVKDNVVTLRLQYRF